MMASPFWDLWYFHIPNYILALATYLMLGRLALTPFVDPRSQNYIWRSFVRFTDPVLAAVGLVTPASVPPIVRLIFAVLWLFLLRLALFALIAQSAAAPAAG